MSDKGSPDESRVELESSIMTGTKLVSLRVPYSISKQNLALESSKKGLQLLRADTKRLQLRSDISRL